MLNEVAPTVGRHAAMRSHEESDQVHPDHFASDVRKGSMILRKFSSTFLDTFQNECIHQGAMLCSHQLKICNIDCTEREHQWWTLLEHM